MCYVEYITIDNKKVKVHPVELIRILIPDKSQASYQEFHVVRAKSRKLENLRFSLIFEDPRKTKQYANWRM
jgi:hypothetical protein